LRPPWGPRHPGAGYGDPPSSPPPPAFAADFFVRRCEAFVELAMANFSELQAISGLIPLLMFNASFMDPDGQRVRAKQTLRSIVNLRSRNEDPDGAGYAQRNSGYPWSACPVPTVQHLGSRMKDVIRPTTSKRAFSGSLCQLFEIVGRRQTYPVPLSAW
jgi:hypothetical protein